MNTTNVRLVAVLTLTAAIALAACTPAGGMSVRDAWIRVTDPNGIAAGYLVIENTSATADALVAVTTPACHKVELHEVVEVPAPTGMASPGAMGSMDGMSGGNTMMRMQQVEEIPVPANGGVELKTGSYHLMLMEPTQPYTIGGTIELTLTFKNGGTVKVTAEIRGV